MKAVIKVNAKNGKSADIIVSECSELGELTAKFDRTGTDYDLEFITEEN